MRKKSKKNFKKKENLDESTMFISACKTCSLHREDGEDYCRYINHPMQNTYQSFYTLQEWCEEHGRSPIEYNYARFKVFVMNSKNPKFLSKEEVDKIFEKLTSKAKVKIGRDKYEFRFSAPLPGQELEENELYCTKCPLNDYCEQIKNPRALDDPEQNFIDFCLRCGRKYKSEADVIRDKSLDNLFPDVEDVLTFARDFSPEVYKKYREEEYEKNRIEVIKQHTSNSNAEEDILLITSKDGKYNLAHKGELIFDQWFSKIIPTKSGKYITEAGYVCVVPVGTIERCLINVSDDTESRIMIGETEEDHRELLEILKEYV